ncbi:protein of unknown function [Shewanella benthica]|uniref:Uncharacterized protein n=1 Tax=Shewanella benthica TaxID=43661 RepID=A0A330M8B2_9GAMM|nr:protein of unknown function [Shewanella benthica]
MLRHWIGVSLHYSRTSRLTYFRVKGELLAKIQHWNDGSEWLENRYSVALNYAANTWIEGRVFVVSVEHSEYNLDPYAKVAVDDADYLPILPWDKDTLVRFHIDMPWDF